MLDAHHDRIRELEGENKRLQTDNASLRLQVDHLERTRAVATDLAGERLKEIERLTTELRSALGYAVSLTANLRQALDEDLIKGEKA